ncbi:SusC/RagA family TonB-linked outer membrane protein [uncultured Muribaculum sp.]|uniref:SusC/RagA family TonB-linked outer membrane protein n=1 Tax=uncultured Muribaculum sp. TaxID=1918613 RepID=UPI0025DA254E|nr:SusC/RagA family TonB-linked outer membrane protein [uncultured Muribaculum sp.]
MIKRLLISALMLLPLIGWAQDAITATGTVYDGTDEPLIGVSVMVKGTSNGTATDIDGNFSIKLNKGNTLVFSYIGYATQEIKVENGTPLHVVLKEDSQLLDEVVVTAMGIQRKESSLTYATQEIKGDDLMKVQDANFVNSLNGKVSGVTITQSAGGAGGTSKILLRGNKSVMGNNSPLIVVDGIPMTNQVGKAAESNWDGGSGLGYSGSSEGGDALSLINPDDIESINVLKGANAAALYGSAAANGVLMITTKKGKEGKISITVNSNVTFDKPLSTPDLQSVYGSLVTLNSSGEANGMRLGAWGKKIGTYTDAELAYANAKLRNTTSDHVDDFFRTGTTWNNSFSISGGTEKVRSYFSYANSNSEGMMPNNSYNRNTFSFRQNYNLLDNKLKIDLSINYVYAKNKNRPGGGTVMNPLYDLYRVPGNVDMDYYRDNYVDWNGKWESNDISYLDKTGKTVIGRTMLEGPQQLWAYNAAGNNNPYWLTNMNRGQQTEERVYGSAVISYEIIPGLMVQGRLNVDRSKFQGETRRYATTQNVAQMEDFGIYGQDIYSSNDWYVDVMASYNKTFAEALSVSASTGWVGHTVKGTTQKIWTQATYFEPLSMRKMPTLVNYFDPTARWSGGNGASYGRSSNWDKGWFFTGQLGWKDMVYLEGSYRIDWYRSFKQFADRGTPDHYGYWSLGANTLVHRYLKLPEVITHLKLRASYSEVGNSIPNEVFSKGSANLVTGALATSTYGYFDNPRPEKSKSFEAGYDISLFNSTLNWDLTYYDTKLTNSYFLAATTGGKSKPVNTGCIRNRGIETSISYNILAGRDWTWKTGFNVAYNDNKIEKTFKDEQGNPSKMEQLIANNSIAVRYEEGGSYGDIYALDFRRNDDGSIYIDPQAGTPVKSSNSYIYLGNMNSKWNLGWSNTVRWKDLSLYFLISGRIGGKFISLTEAYLDQAGISQRTADARLAYEANPEKLTWVSSDGQTRKPGMMAHGTLVPIEDYYNTVGGQTIASEYVYDATNFRLGEVSISYTMRDLFHGAIKGLTLSAVGRNLFFIYKDCPSDPDIALSTKNGLGAFDIFNMPSARSYGINLKLEF